MNIFALSDNPTQAAQWQHDRHVVKMILESAQMLSVSAPDLLPSHFRHLAYKPTHANHPCNVWLRESFANVAWLVIHGNALVAEYHRRFRKLHATLDLLRGFQSGLVDALDCGRAWIRNEQRGLMLNPAIIDCYSQHTPFAVCMPDEFKDERSGEGLSPEVRSYRNLYLESKIFQSHVKWTACDSIPRFLFEIPDASPRACIRLEELAACHNMEATERKRRLELSMHPHPDLLKSVNPKALTRFGTK